MNTSVRNFFLFGLLALSACDSQSVVQIESGVMQMPVPRAIREVASLNSRTLEVQISINGEIARVEPITDSNEISTSVVNVPVDQNIDLTVAWFAIIEGSQKVLLADFSTVVLAGTSELDVTNYNSVGARFDADNDGRSNLSEARENRNLLSSVDLEVPLVAVGASVGGVIGTIRESGMDTDLSGDQVEADQLSTFSLRHDGTDLIVYVCGKDRVLQNDSLTSDGQQYWHDDAIFIFLDGADSDNGSYDGVDDFQIAILRGTEQRIVAKGRDNEFCTAGDCIFHQFLPSFDTACAYELTVSLPLAELNMTVGTPIGFDIEITDDDNGGKRDSSSAWIGFDDRSDENPSTFGTITLK